MDDSIGQLAPSRPPVGSGALENKSNRLLASRLLVSRAEPLLAIEVFMPFMVRWLPALLPEDIINYQGTVGHLCHIMDKYTLISP